MGTSRSVGELTGKFKRYVGSVGEANRAGTSAAALRYKEQALRNATRDTGGDRKLSGVAAGRFGIGRKAPELKANYRLYGYVNAKAVLRPSPYGMWALLDGGAAPHQITPFRYKRRRDGSQSARELGAVAQGGRAAQALSVPGAGRNGMGFVARVEHPGSPAKMTFRSVPAQARRAATRSFSRSHSEALRRVFR